MTTARRLLEAVQQGRPDRDRIAVELAGLVLQEHEQVHATRGAS
ncbi:hypothetical protein [Pendulispora albinea]